METPITKPGQPQGFFTTMLWRRRWLGSLIRQRFTRVLVPLAIGLVTVVPIMNWVVDESAAAPDIVTAVVVGDAEGVQRFIDDGYELEARGKDGGTILHLAALLGSAEVVEVLLEAGADPNALTFAGDPPLGAAFVFGNEAAADLLVEYGGPEERLPGGDWADLEGWGFAADEIEAPQDDREGPESWVESFHHLWFLCFLVAGFVVVAWMSELPARATWAILVGLIAVTWWSQYLMGEQGAFRVFGPDTSTGLVPDPHVIGYYAVVFAFGALMYGTRGRDGTELADTLGRKWGIVLPITVAILLPVALYATFGDGNGDEPWAWGIASLFQAVYAWGMLFGLIGFFRLVLSVERRGVRYLSDSAYWLYRRTCHWSSPVRSGSATGTSRPRSNSSASAWCRRRYCSPATSCSSATRPSAGCSTAAEPARFPLASRPEASPAG